MEKFIMFFRGGSEVNPSDEWAVWFQKLSKMGALVTSGHLVKDGAIVKDEGETVQDFVFKVNDHARGFAIIRAESLEKAVQLTRGCPVFSEGGNVTVRPLGVRR